MNGILVIDKAEGMTSHDVVNAVRVKFKLSKVGHLGTLDPMATGVLPVCVGKATRIAQFLSGSPKEYIGQIRFGFATDTYDRQGKMMTEERPFRASAQQVTEAMVPLTGTIDQVPPAYSAKKIGGVPSYKLARKGREVEIPSARVQVHAFELTELVGDLMTFRVLCSSGTYIRCLAHDLGQRLGCGAHLASLRRLQSGDFRIGQAVSVQDISPEALVGLDVLLTSWPRMDVSGPEETKVAHGNQIPCDFRGEFARIFNKKGEFMAVGKLESGWVVPRVVLTSITSD
jgi:tRNA pseudouridine55 synthase